MKKFFIIISIIIITLVSIIIISLNKDDSSKYESSTDEYSRNYTINLLEKGKDYKNYSCQSSIDDEIYKKKDKKLLIKKDNAVDTYIDLSTNKKTIIYTSTKNAFISTIDADSIDRTYFQVILMHIKNTKTYNYKYLGKENIDNYNCIKVELSSKEITYNIWIDISSGLVTKIYYHSPQVDYPVTIEFNLKLDCVTDDEVEMPDLTNYTITEK